jgi:hypothetical protein
MGYAATYSEDVITHIVLIGLGVAAEQMTIISVHTGLRSPRLLPFQSWHS